MKIALVGLPGSGKTTLFCALAGLADAHPSHVVDEPLEAVVPLPDPRLELLRDHFQPKKFTPANLAVLDFMGWPTKDNADGKARLVAAIRQADAFAIVLQGFTPAGLDIKPDPARDRLRLLDEFALGDLGLVEKRIHRLEKDLQRGSKNRDEDKKELAVLQRIHPALYEGKTIRDLGLSDEELRPLRGFGFLTGKPRLVILNHGENIDPNTLTGWVGEGERGITLAATAEKELAVVADEAERRELMDMLGIQEIARPRVLRAAYETLGLSCFFTVGPDEVRAWTIPTACPAVEAAAAVHSDIQRGFIRAEVVAYADYLKAGGMKEAKAKNLMRLEGKEYPVQDGDIINFRFSV